MTRCEAFYERWQKSPNWCEHTKSSVSRIDAYMRLVDQLEKKGIHRELTIGNLSEGAARPITQIWDEQLKTLVMAEIRVQLKENEHINGGPRGYLSGRKVERIIAEAQAQLERDATSIFYEDPIRKAERELAREELYKARPELKELMNEVEMAADTRIKQSTGETPRELEMSSGMLDRLNRMMWDAFTAINHEYIDTLVNLAKREQCYTYVTKIRDMCDSALKNRRPIVFDGQFAEVLEGQRESLDEPDLTRLNEPEE